MQGASCANVCLSPFGQVVFLLFIFGRLVNNHIEGVLTETPSVAIIEIKFRLPKHQASFNIETTDNSKLSNQAKEEMS